jgi:16S rRNA (cytidine1402-2'-O)-methyltransferase
MPLPEVTLTPGLYLVGTPIGHLADITLRALSVLRAADVVLCEDTRVTGKLLKHYDIKAKLRVYNDQSEGQNHQGLIKAIDQGQVVALVSDAGMPLLSDPGYQLVQACVQAGVNVVPIPGPSAILSAVQISGLPSDAFLFLGFLPNKVSERAARLQAVAGVSATLVLFERASRVPALLQAVVATLGDRPVAVVREITKLFEETRRGTAQQVMQDIEARPIKGEVVVLIDRGTGDDIVDDAALTEALRAALQHQRLRDAVDAVAAQTNAPRKHVYDLALKIKDET